MSRIADILVDDLIRAGLSKVFMVTGGGAMHLNDAFARRRDVLSICCNHHEQACAMAAEGYARIANKPAILNVTTGPGGLNALNGVHGAYVDSIPMIVISGQIKRDTMLGNFSMPLRQLGDQEVDIISMVRPITKYAAELIDPLTAREILAKAIFVSTHGRPGPVWLDVPLDVQSFRVTTLPSLTWSNNNFDDIRSLRGDPNLNPNSLSDFTLADTERCNDAIAVILEKLKSAKRPVILGGSGIHLSGMEKEFLHLGEILHVPLVGGWNAYDLVPNKHPCYAGRPGTVGDRAGNFTVQNADFLLVLGCRCNIRQISYNWKAFAKNAWKAMVDADIAELHKPILRNDMALQADLRDFIPQLLTALENWTCLNAHAKYLSWCQTRVKKYPVCMELDEKSPLIHPYRFMDVLFSQLTQNDIVVAANATAAVVSGQCGEMKTGLRMFSNSGSASMGYDLPAAIGASMADRKKRIICLAGDGSIMMNLQELQTIIAYDLPILIFLLNNNGYLSIRMTQENYFADNKFGTGPDNGVTFPNFIEMAQGFGFRTKKIVSSASLEDQIKECLSSRGPAFFEIMLDPEQKFSPKLVSRILPDGSMASPELDDMFPFLSEKELSENRLG